MSLSFSRLLLVGVVLAGASFQAAPAFPASEASPAKGSALLDIDAMAARMKTGQELYQKTRDEALAGYATRNPQPKPSDDAAKTTIRLLAYLSNWTDFYGENLWHRESDYLARATAQGAQDPLLDGCDLILTSRKLSDTEEGLQQAGQKADLIVLGAYPILIKLAVIDGLLADCVYFQQKHPAAPNAPSQQLRAHFLDQWGQNYRALIKQGTSHDKLFHLGASLHSLAGGDEDMLNRAIAEEERSFNETDPKNPVRLELDSDYYVSAAWIARGSGYADTITKEGGQLFADRLAKAAQILEPLYDAFPNETNISLTMMRVELGQGQGRDRMEKWFQRAIKADPDSFDAYKSKEWYLQPRWFGSNEDIFAFGKECVQTGNWSAKIPMIFPISISEISQNEPTIYNNADLWSTLDKVYLDYFSHYPNATMYRTLYAVHAYDGGHRDTALAQFQILGDDWDRRSVPAAKYAAIMADLQPPK